MRAGFRGMSLVSLLAALHVLLGMYAVYDDGFFVFGLTAPERLLYHAAAGDETRITVSGAQKHLVEDTCLQSCEICPLDCYSPAKLRIVCEGGCRMLTDGGRVLAKEGDFFESVVRQGVLYDNATFRCYDGACGFDMQIDENITYSAQWQ